MDVSIQITLNTNDKKHAPSINDFINRLNGYDDIVVKPNALGTKVSGDLERTMDIINDEFENSFREEIKSNFNMKLDIKHKS